AGHAHEAGRAAFVRAIGLAVGVGGGQEEQRAAFDERAVFVTEVPARQFLVEPVGEAARVEAVLQRSHTGVVRRGCFVVHDPTPSKRPPAGAPRPARLRRSRPPPWRASPRDRGTLALVERWRRPTWLGLSVLGDIFAQAEVVAFRVWEA